MLPKDYPTKEQMQSLELALHDLAGGITRVLDKLNGLTNDQGQPKEADEYPKITIDINQRQLRINWGDHGELLPLIVTDGGLLVEVDGKAVSLDCAINNRISW